MGVKIKVAIAEDNLKFRKAFLRLMRSEDDLEFIIEAENGADLLLQLESRSPDIILLDIRIPVMDGFEAGRIIQIKYAGLKIVAFTQFDLEENIIEMNRIGVKSFIGKDQIDQVARILKVIHQGGVYFPDQVAKILSGYLTRIPSLFIKCPIKLSEIEMTLLQCMCKGLSSPEIGEIIYKSSRTVEKYRTDLYRKFKVANKEQLIVEASKWNLVE